jgi:hypothetical protein
MIRVIALFFILVGTLSTSAECQMIESHTSALSESIAVIRSGNSSDHQSGLSQVFICNPSGIPQPENTDDKIENVSDLVIHGPAINLNDQQLALIEVFLLRIQDECPEAFTDPPYDIHFFNLLFRVIISPNAP